MTVAELEQVSDYYDVIAKNKSKLMAILNDLFEKIVPRDNYTFVHSELGPNHVMVDGNLETFLIDIEGAKFFDVEYEHSFLQFRFGSFYQQLKIDQLDPDRLTFYALHLHIAYLLAASELKEKGYHDQKELEQIISFNLDQVIAFVYN